MFTIISIVSGFFLVLLFGYNFSRIILPEVESLEHLSLGFILGSGIFTFVWFFLNMIGIPYNLVSGLSLLIILNVVVFKSKNKKFTLNLSYFKNLNLIEKFFIGLIFFLFFSALIQDLYWPIRYWDSLALYDFRAKILSETGFVQPVISSSYFLGYPLFTSLSHTWVYLLGGSNPNFFYALLYIFLVINIFFNFKKLNIGRLSTLFFTLMVAITPMLFDHSQWAYTNLPFSTYLILGTIYLYFGIKNRDFGSLIISAVSIGLSTWTRSFEPFWMACVIFATIEAIIVNKWIWPFVYTAIVISFILPWKFFVTSYKVPDFTANVVNQVTSIASTVTQNTETNTVPILKSTIDFILTNMVGVFLIYFLLLAVIILIKLHFKSKNWHLVFLIIFYLALICVGTFIFIETNSRWQEVASSLTRMAMFIPPLIIFLTATLLSETKRD